MAVIGRANDPLDGLMPGGDLQAGHLDPQLVDGRGRSISTAVLYELACAMSELPPGALIRVRVDPLPALDSDIRACAEQPGTSLVEIEQAAGACDYTVRKAAELREQPGWAIVISKSPVWRSCCPRSASRLPPPWPGARSRSSRDPRFACWHARSGRSWPAGSAPSAPSPVGALTKLGTPRPHEKLRQLHELGARIYVCGPSMAHFKVAAEDLFLPGVKIAAYPTSSNK